MLKPDTTFLHRLPGGPLVDAPVHRAVLPTSHARPRLASTLLTHAGLVAVAAIWGASWASGRTLVTDLSPPVAAMMRYALAAPLFLAWLTWVSGHGQLKLPPTTDRRQLWIIALLGTFAYQLLFMLGMTLTGAADASLIITVNPLFTALLAQFVLRERLSPRIVAGLALGLSGVTVITGWSPNTQIPLVERLLGGHCILVAAFVWGAHAVLIQRLAARSPSTTPQVAMAWSSVLGFILLLPVGMVAWGLEGFSWPSWSEWAHIAYLGVLSTVLAHLLFAKGIHVVGARVSALYVYLVPVFGVLTAALLLDERLGWAWAGGFALILVGLQFGRRPVGGGPPTGAPVAVDGDEHPDDHDDGQADEEELTVDAE